MKGDVVPAGMHDCCCGLYSHAVLFIVNVVSSKYYCEQTDDVSAIVYAMSCCHNIVFADEGTSAEGCASFHGEEESNLY